MRVRRVEGWEGGVEGHLTEGGGVGFLFVRGEDRGRVYIVSYSERELIRRDGGEEVVGGWWLVLRSFEDRGVLGL